VEASHVFWLRVTIHFTLASRNFSTSRPNIRTSDTNDLEKNLHRNFKNGDEVDGHNSGILFYFRNVETNGTVWTNDSTRPVLRG
jgi:hypothetical protein